MTESTFDAVFTAAKRRGLKLNNFFQLGNMFRANWRLGDDKNTFCSEFIDNAVPFRALEESLAVAIRTMPKREPEAAEQGLFD